MASDKTPQIWVEKDLPKHGWGLSLLVPMANGGWSAAKDVAMGPVESGECTPSFLTLPDATMQQLMNQLWNVGFRPASEGSEGEMQATKKHLEDMRTIAFDLLQLKK